MASPYVGLEFEDGSTQVVRILPIDLVMFEREQGRSPSTMEDSLRLVYATLLRKGGAAGGDFDGWMAKVVDFDPDPEVDTAPLDVTPSTTNSPDSP